MTQDNQEPQVTEAEKEAFLKRRGQDPDKETTETNPQEYDETDIEMGTHLGF